MPSALYAYQTDYDSPTQQDQEVVDYFNAENITLYESTWSFNITLGNMEALEDTPVADHQIEFFFTDSARDYIEVRHAYPTFWFGLWLEYHRLNLVDSDFALTQGQGGSNVPWLLYKEDILALSINENASSFEMYCEHVSMSFAVLSYNSSKTLSESWDDGELTVYSSYNIDFDAMKPSAFLLIAQLITFQSPDFGIPGDFGTVFNYGFGIGFWIVIAIIIYTLITRIIPTIQGGLED